LCNCNFIFKILGSDILNGIKEIIENQRQFFKSGKTKDSKYRIMQLKILKQAIIGYEKEIFNGLKLDLNKPEFESYATEVGIVLKEIDNAISSINKWCKPVNKILSKEFFPSKGTIYHEPYGVVLIIAPWNYPFQLIFSPLVGAISAGNCVVLKPSEYAVNTSNIVYEIIKAHFNENFVTCIEGGKDVNQNLLREKFDYIFFTGGSEVGKIVMKAAAENLTPVTLELGGKSPCIVDKDVDLKTTADRIVWGKFINAGQTCVAPDYILVNNSVKSDFIKCVIGSIKKMYGNNIFGSGDYVNIINIKHFKRLKELIKGENIIYGGLSSERNLKIEPTIVDSPKWTSSIMKEEIFGPILPVIGYDDIDSVINKINSLPKPLALYVFTNNSHLEKSIISQISFGGGCINDTVMHVGTLNMPFGGVGNSGMGSYHGIYSFMTFSHTKSVLKKSFGFDMPLRYPPYKNKLKILKKLLK